MGKAFKWFRGLLGLRKPDPTATPTKLKHHKWRFAKSHRETEKDKHRHRHHHQDNPSDTRTNHTVDVGPDEHAVAVAAATAAVAEAAVAAAQAAAAVVKLTSSGRCVQPTTTYVREEDTGMEWAAIKIQAAFRGFLARKALRALRGLVRLQALVRGHIERKRTAEWVQRMQALLKAQARARAGRIQPSELMNSSVKSSYFSPLDPATPEKFEHSPHTKSTRFKQLQRTGSRFTTIDDEKIDRILEIENERTYFKLEPKNLFNSIKLALSSDLPNRRFAASREPVTYHTVPDLSSCDTRCLSPMEFSHEVEESSFFSVSSKGASTKKSPFTPTKSDNSSRSYFSGDSEYPNYMACTQSSKAKMRSHSAPRQRPQYERSSSAKRYSVHGFGESRLTAQQISTLQSNFIGKAYPGSGRLDKLGMPVCY